MIEFDDNGNPIAIDGSRFGITFGTIEANEPYIKNMYDISFQQLKKMCDAAIIKDDELE